MLLRNANSNRRKQNTRLPLWEILPTCLLPLTRLHYDIPVILNPVGNIEQIAQVRVPVHVGEDEVAILKPK